jgi:hypothetical protein
MEHTMGIKRDASARLHIDSPLMAESLMDKRLLEGTQARDLASAYSLHLQGLGGTEDGVIGALAAAGLAACGEDGRYLLVGTVRQLAGRRAVRACRSNTSIGRAITGSR